MYSLNGRLLRFPVGVMPESREKLGAAGPAGEADTGQITEPGSGVDCVQKLGREEQMKREPWENTANTAGFRQEEALRSL